MTDNNDEPATLVGETGVGGDDNDSENDDNSAVENDALTSTDNSKLIDGADIANILHSEGPVVKCVLLRAPTRRTDDDDDADETDTNDPGKRGRKLQEGQKENIEDLIEELEIDTTPQKNEVEKILGGSPTFIGQFPGEGIVLMALRGLVEQTEEDEEEPQVPQERNDDGNDEGGGGNTEAKSKTHISNTKRRGFSKMTIRELRAQCLQWGVNMDEMVEKGDLVDALRNKEESLPLINPHKLQPPLHNVRVRGPILILKVAEVDDDSIVEEKHEEDREETGHENEENADDFGKGEGGRSEQDGDFTLPTTSAARAATVESSNFFLPYTKKQYLTFVARGIAVKPLATAKETTKDDNNSSEEEKEGDEDEDDNDEDFNLEEEEMTEEEEKSAMLNIVMNELLRKFRADNGRGPDSQEVLEIRASVAEQIGVEVLTYDESLEAAEQAAQAPMKNGKKRGAVDTGRGLQNIGNDDDGKTEGRPPPRKRVKFHTSLVSEEPEEDEGPRIGEKQHQPTEESSAKQEAIGKGDTSPS